MPKKRKIPQPTTLADQAVARFQINSASSRPREFRDGLTRAVGAFRGVPTNSSDAGNRWTP